MNDVYIAPKNVDFAALKILNGPNFSKISDSENNISRKVYLNTKKVWDDDKKSMKSFIGHNLDFYIWTSKNEQD